MPVIGISVARLHELLRTEIESSAVERILDEIGCDVEGVVNVHRYSSLHSDYVIDVTPQESLPLTDPTSGFTGEKPEDVWRKVGEETVVRLDLLPVRPDIFDAGGLARALRGYLGNETGLRDYAAADATWRVDVDERIVDARFGRPLIQCAIVRNLTIDDNVLRAIMRLQENLHWALCRDRKFASIGAYDLATLESPISYTLVDREEFRFKPLFWGQRDPVSPDTMLTEHPKGTAYAHLVDGMELLPALISANGNVLSLPPIINADETKLTTDTRDVLLDVTGSNAHVVEKALAILATSLVELDPESQAQLERVEMAFPDRTVETPALASEEYSVDPAFAKRWLGIDITLDDCAELLMKMRHGVGRATVSGRQDGEQGSVGRASLPAMVGTEQEGKAGRMPAPLEDSYSTSNQSQALTVTVPAYRCDIMHEVDLVEDIAIAYGYHNIKPKLVPTFTAGKSLPINVRSRQAAAALTGLGFTETMSLVLTNERDHYEKLRREITPRRVTLENPASTEQTMLREHLYSSLLELLAMNTDHPLPQRIFEVGDVVTYAGITADEEQPRELRVIAGAICATRTGYAEGRSMLDALMHEMGAGGEYSPASEEQNPTALPGRAAVVHTSDGNGNAGSDGGGSGHCIAEVFEVHPEVLEYWKLGNPVVLFSLLLGDAEYS